MRIAKLISMRAGWPLAIFASLVVGDYSLLAQEPSIGSPDVSKADLRALDAAAQRQKAASAHGHDVSREDLRVLDAAARRQNAAAAPGKAVSMAEVQKGIPAVPLTRPGSQPAAPTQARQQQLIKTAIESVASEHKPGTASYAQAVDFRLLQLKLENFPDVKAARPAMPRLPGTIDPGSIYNSVQWRRNRDRQLQQLASPSGGGLRVVGGETAGINEFLDCVAICQETTGTSFASGTLIGKNVVLTAGHVAVDSRASFVYFGPDANSSNPGQAPRLAVVHRLVHPQYDPNTHFNDVGLLILEKSVESVAPRSLAARPEIDGASSLEIVGFGYTTVTMQNLGVKTKIGISIASRPNATPQETARDEALYGFHVRQEIVAGAFGHDSCQGDSGGPAYIQVGTTYKLAGVTSRSTANSRQDCGDGGVYERVDAYAEWIIGTAKVNGGILP